MALDSAEQFPYSAYDDIKTRVIVMRYLVSHVTISVPDLSSEKIADW